MDKYTSTEEAYKNGYRDGMKAASQGRVDCTVCKALNEEKEAMSVSEIYIYGAGYYNFSIPIYYCPQCGKPLKKYKKE